MTLYRNHLCAICFTCLSFYLLGIQPCLYRARDYCYGLVGENDWSAIRISSQQPAHYGRWSHTGTLYFQATPTLNMCDCKTQSWTDLWDLFFVQFSQRFSQGGSTERIHKMNFLALILSMSVRQIRRDRKDDLGIIFRITPLKCMLRPIIRAVSPRRS